MKRIFYLIAVALFFSTGFLLAENKPYQMTMTTGAENVRIFLGGTGTATIDWGNGTDKEKITLSNFLSTHRHIYSDTNSRTITITGDSVFTLWANAFELTHLDVSKNPVLQELRAGNNRLTSINLSNNTELRHLYFRNNQLTELDISNNKELRILNVSRNYLTSLDSSQNEMLEVIEAFSNQLTVVDVSGSKNLRYLNLFGNQLTDIDISNNRDLTRLTLFNNQITSIDVSNNTKLVALSLGSNYLTNLCVRTNTALEELWSSNNLLSASALNALFETLHSNPLTFGKDLYTDGNPGASTADESIAKGKGWRVNQFEILIEVEYEAPIVIMMIDDIAE